MKQHTLIKGFTLLELLVAMAIFSLVSVMAYSGLKTVLDINEASHKNSERLAEIQLAISRITSELSHITSRQVRSSFGTKLSVFTASEYNPVEWTHSANRASLSDKRVKNGIRRVGYLLEDGVLFRLVWPHLDRVSEDYFKVAVLHDVEKIEWRFLDDPSSNQWWTQWPLATATLPSSDIPQAVEFKLELKDWGEITQLVVLPRV